VKKTALSFAAAQQLHREGRLQEAKSAYLALLEVKENQAEVLHYLGILYAEEGDDENAARCLSHAVQMNPHDLSLRLHLASIYKSAKKFDLAITVLQEVIALNPESPAAFNNLGTIYDAKKQWDDAVLAYHAAIKLQPNYADAYYNLGLVLTKAHRMKEAMNTYQSLLELAPDHAGARFQLGRLYMQQNKYQEAIRQFSSLEENHPFHVETQTNLATSYLKLGGLNQAREHYLKALNIMPDDIQVLFNLGVIAVQQSRLSDAIEFYARAAAINPDFCEAHNNLGVAYLFIKDRKNAVKHFREVLRLQPDNKALQHTVDILARDKELTGSPPEYIRSLFDSYADHYDVHLVNTLKYDVPQQLFTMVNKHIDVASLHGNILDLGCGTGLCGELFKGKHSTLTGVDISSKMLDAAEQKKIYQKLIEAEIDDFLKDQHAVYDLILAGDVIVYFGDLQELFSCVYQALKSEGLFVFNAEINHEKNFELTESGRFSHSKIYLDKLLHELRFTVLDYQVTRLRSQNEEEVRGHLYLLRKG